MSSTVTLLGCLAGLLLVGCSSPAQRGSVPARDYRSGSAKSGDARMPQFTAPAQPSPVPPPTAPATTAPPATAQVEPLRQTAPAHAYPGNETWVPLQRWCKVTGLAALARLTAPTPAAYSLTSSHGVLHLTVGSSAARWDGIDLRLGFAPQLINGQPYVHRLDLRKTIQPLLVGAPAPRITPQSVIVIDPGHGGDDPGTRSVLGRYFEKEYTLDWAQRLERALAAKGCKVFVTRSKDVDLGLTNRVAFAVERNADLFVSLHFNSAAPSQTEAGLETYCLTPAGLPSSLTRGFADDPGIAFPNNSFDEQNLPLALRVHQALLEVNGHQDRGIRRARFPTVLRGQLCPAVLVEGGYLSNPREARLISDPNYRQKLADAVAKAIVPETQEAKYDSAGPAADAGHASASSSSRKGTAP